MPRHRPPGVDACRGRIDQLSRKCRFRTEFAAPVSSYMVARAPQRFVLNPTSRSTSTSGWRPQKDESGLVDTSNVVWVGYGNFLERQASDRMEPYQPNPYVASYLQFVEDVGRDTGADRPADRQTAGTQQQRMASGSTLIRQPLDRSAEMPQKFRHLVSSCRLV
jgi:hypothetical protein